MSELGDMAAQIDLRPNAGLPRAQVEEPLAFETPRSRIDRIGNSPWRGARVA